MRDLTDKRAIRKLERDARFAAQRRREVITLVASSPAGREYFYSELEASHCFTPSFSTNALTMAFNEGERNRGLRLLADLMQFCPDEYVLMTREANGRQSSADVAAERSSSEDNGRDVEESGLDNTSGDRPSIPAPEA